MATTEWKYKLNMKGTLFVILFSLMALVATAEPPVIEGMRLVGRGGHLDVAGKDEYVPIAGFGVGHTLDGVGLDDVTRTQLYQFNVQVYRIEFGVYVDIRTMTSRKSEYKCGGVKMGWNIAKWFSLGGVWSQYGDRRKAGYGAYVRLTLPTGIYINPYAEGHACLNGDYGIFLGMNVLCYHGR